MLGACVAITASSVYSETVVTLTDTVLRADMPRLGVHFTGDNYWDSPTRKNRVEEGFEGINTRFITSVTFPFPGNNQIVDTAHGISAEMAEQLVALGATYTIVAGPDQWKTGSVTAIERNNPDAFRSSVRLTLDSPFTPQSGDNGIMIDAFDPRGFVEYARIAGDSGSDIAFNHAMNGGNVDIKIGDGAPTWGENSLRLNGSGSAAYYRLFYPRK